MAKLQSLIREVLYEEKEKNLKIIYNTDIFIQDFQDEEKPKEETPEEPEAEPVAAQPVVQEPAVEPAATTQPVAPVESVEQENNLIVEDIFKSKTEGSVVVVQEKAKTILTLNDLLEYLEDEKSEDENQILNDIAVEIVKSLSDADTKDIVSDVLHKGDKCNITLDYGFDEKDSIGFQISKNAGVDLATMIMRKDSEPMTGPFNLQVFNQTITGVFLKEIQ